MAQYQWGQHGAGGGGSAGMAQGGADTNQYAPPTATYSGYQGANEYDYYNYPQTGDGGYAGGYQQAAGPSPYYAPEDGMAGAPYTADGASYGAAGAGYYDKAQGAEGQYYQDPTAAEYGGAPGAAPDNMYGGGYDQTGYGQYGYPQYDQYGYDTRQQQQQPYVEYDQYGQPLQYDEQGQAYDYYGVPVTNPAEGEGYYQEQNGVPATTAAGYYDPYDPYNVQGYQQAPAVPTMGYDPAAYPEQPATQEAHGETAAPESKELEIEATVSKRKREKKKKKKKHVKELIVSEIPSALPTTVTLPQQKTVTVVENQPRPPTTRVVRVAPPSHPAFETRPVVVQQAPPTRVVHTIHPPRPPTVVVTAPTGSYPRHHVVLPPPQLNVHTVDITPPTPVTVAPHVVTHQVVTSPPEIMAQPGYPATRYLVNGNREVVTMAAPSPSHVPANVVTASTPLPAAVLPQPLPPRTSSFSVLPPPTSSAPQLLSVPLQPAVAYQPPQAVQSVVTTPEPAVAYQPPQVQSVVTTPSAGVQPPLKPTPPPINVIINSAPAPQSGTEPRTVVQRVCPVVEQPQQVVMTEPCSRPGFQRHVVRHQVVKLAPGNAMERSISPQFHKRLSNRKRRFLNSKTPPEVYLVQSQVVPQSPTSTTYEVTKSGTSPYIVQPQNPSPSCRPDYASNVHVVQPAASAQTLGPRNVITTVSGRTPRLPVEATVHTQMHPDAFSAYPAYPQHAPIVSAHPSAPPEPVTTITHCASPQPSSYTHPYATVITQQMPSTAATVLQQPPGLPLDMSDTSRYYMVEDKLQPPPRAPQWQAHIMHGAPPITVVPEDSISQKHSLTSSVDSGSVEETSDDDVHDIIVKRHPTASESNFSSASFRVAHVTALPSEEEARRNKMMIDRKADRLADENLRLQRDIAGLRRRLERAHGIDQAVSDLTIGEQNEGLRYQLRDLNKAIHDFTYKMPQTDDGAKLIEELAFQFNVALDDLSRVHQRLREKEGQLQQAEEKIHQSRERESERAETLKDMVEHVRNNDSYNLPHDGKPLYKLVAPHGGVPYNEIANLPSAVPEWYRSPIQADDIRHEMGLIDDLIGQCQRIVAEATDNLWVVEYAVKDVVDRVFDAFGLTGKPMRDLFENPKSRQHFLEELKQSVDRHLTEVFSTRTSMDRIQDQISNIKAHAWDPKRNIPYCSCRPRRDLLEDDVTHLMERLHEAGDQACQLRERLLAMELQNLTLRLEESQLRGGTSTAAMSRMAAEAKVLAEERRKLQEKTLALEHQLRYLHGSSHGLLKSEPARPKADFAEGAKETGSPPIPGLKPKGRYDPDVEKDLAQKRHAVRYKEPSKQGVVRQSSFRAWPRGRALSTDAVAGHVPLPLSRGTVHQPSQTKAPPSHEDNDSLKKKKLRDELMAELDRYERTYLGIQKELTETTSPDGQAVLHGTQYRVVARMRQGAQQLRELIDKIERGLQREADLALAYSISMDLRNLATEAEMKLDKSKVTDKERRLLDQVQRQAERLLETNVALQKFAKCEEKRTQQRGG